MKLSSIFLMLYPIALLISLTVSATLSTSAIDYTIKCGLVIHEEYIISAVISVVITAVMLYYYKKHFPEDIDNDQT